MSGFEVDHQKLIKSGQEMSQHGTSASTIATDVQKAEVPTIAWGLLGIECGLYEMYVGMLADLNQHLSDMGQHLDQTSSAMVSTGQAYQQVDQAIQQNMKQIAPETESA